MRILSKKGYADSSKKMLYFQESEEYKKSDQKCIPLWTLKGKSMVIGNRAALYMRVSTADQKVDLQADNLRAYAKRAGLCIVHEYLDVAVSGRKQGRPQLDALLKGARSHAFDCILVWKFDRFARSTKHLLTALEEFNYLNIRFVSVQDQIDTTSPMGKAMFTLIAAMAELESSLISERVTAGMMAAKARGKNLGRPQVPLHIITRVEEAARTTELSIRKIHHEYGQGISRGMVGEIVKRVRNEIL